MAVTAYEPVKQRTGELERAVYAALDACDAYAKTVTDAIAAELAKPEPNDKVVKRLRQFEARVGTITTLLEDDVITEMLFLVDRLTMLQRAEEGTFI